MRKSPMNRNAIMDTLHKGFVCTCIAVTLYGFSVLGLRYYTYVTEIKPKLKAQRLLEEQNLLREGSADVLQDTAQTLS